MEHLTLAEVTLVETNQLPFCFIRFPPWESGDGKCVGSFASEFFALGQIRLDNRVDLLRSTALHVLDNAPYAEAVMCGSVSTAKAVSCPCRQVVCPCTNRVCLVHRLYFSESAYAFIDKRCAEHQVYGFFGGSGHSPDVAMLVAHEVLFHRPLQML